VHEFLANSKVTVVSHPPYSPDLFLYPKLKIALMGKRLNIIKIQLKLQEMCQASIHALSEVVQVGTIAVPPV
jgi:transposase